MSVSPFVCPQPGEDMAEFAVDIVVPVWNFPVETRSCLVSLAEHSPEARLILVDNASDRDTERLLQELAEILDRRALLVRTDVNLGFVRAANLGLVRGEAECLAVVRPTSVVGPGWLEPLLRLAREEKDAGIIVPTLAAEGRRKGAGTPAVNVEADHGSFAATLVRKELYDRVGGFDEAMDGGEWCLKDYSRRAWRSGFRTCGVSTPPVTFREGVPLGSATRRQESLRRSGELYRERWGEEGSFCVSLAGMAAEEVFRHCTILQEGARQGDRFIVFLPRERSRDIPSQIRHENIRWMIPPRFLAQRWLSREVARLREHTPEVVMVGEGFPGVEALALAGLAERIESARRTRYTCGSDTEGAGAALGKEG